MIPTGHEVLVVDDEAVVLTVLREALRRGGYRVTTAASAEEAIDLMQRRRFDLVLTDKNLPGASGLDVLRAARTVTPSPAIVLITGYSSYDSALEALDIGAHDYIEKPIHDVEDLRFRIRRALSRRDEQLARPRLATTGGRSGRVLLVEVEGARRQLIADYLGKAYHVTSARDGDEALRADQARALRSGPGRSPPAGRLGAAGDRARAAPAAALRVGALHSLPVVRIGQGGVRDRRRRLHGAAERGPEKIGREGRRSAQRSGRNPVRVTARANVATDAPTCESHSPTTCA